MTLQPCEWNVLHPLDGQPLAIIRLVFLGPRREARFRAVTPDVEREQRQLLGYWSSVDLAHEGALAIVERRLGHSLSGAGAPPSRPLVPQSPPPQATHEAGRPARPEKHSSRA